MLCPVASLISLEYCTFRTEALDRSYHIHLYSAFFNRSIATTAANALIADPFTRHTCWSLRKNVIGERSLLTEGMSIVDLMHAYSSSQPFTDVQNWKSGYCFHSDHALAYFFNMYNVAEPESELEAAARFTDSLRTTYTYSPLTNTTGNGRKGECSNEKEMCTVHRRQSNMSLHRAEPDGCLTGRNNKEFMGLHTRLLFHTP
jgi:hypothetical protein